MKLLAFLLMVLVVFPFVSSQCEGGQIDINTASLEELKSFTGIGDVKAQAIIESRPFNSVGDLIDVYGIGEVTLQNMKNEGACVDDEEKDETVEIVENKTTISEKINLVEEETRIINANPIILNPKNIKSENNLVFDRENYSVYGLIVFCILLAFLFLIKNKQDTNEFRRRN